MIQVKVEGLSDLAEALKQLPKEIASKNGGPLRNALRASARLIRNEARLRAPVETGRLRNAIAIQVDRNPGNVTERLVVRPRRGRSRTDPKGAYYWHFTEFGSEQQPAQPYMRPAFDSTKDQMLTTFKRSLANGIKRAVKKVQRNRRGR